MERSKINPSQRDQSHEVYHVFPNLEIQDHHTPSPTLHHISSIEPSDLPSHVSQLSSPGDLTISALSQTTLGTQVTDVIRDFNIPDPDLAIIPDWFDQTQRQPGLVPSPDLSNWQNSEVHTTWERIEEVMVRRTTRSRARDDLSAVSAAQTVPQKRKRMASEPPANSTANTFIQSEDSEVLEQKGAPIPSAAHDEVLPQASLTADNPFKSPQPVMLSFELESSEPRDNSSSTTKDVDALGSPSGMEGDSGISLASSEREQVILKDNDPRGASTGPAESSVSADGIPNASDINQPASYPQPASEVKNSGDFIELPHNLGTVPASTNVARPYVSSTVLPKEIQPQAREETAINLTADQKIADGTSIPAPPLTREADARQKKVKKSNYGLTPGQSPFPDFKAPSAKACREVNDLLSKVHGEVIAPKTIPEPSLTVTGCGEVPSVLDALIRTLLSGATNGRNSARAFNGLVERFGVLKEGIGKGSVNWDAVRRAPLRDVYRAIESGGLADIKSKNLKALLDQVYEENQERKNRHVPEDSSATDTEKSGISPDEAKEVEEAKEYDIASANDHFLNLQYIHKYKTSKAMKALIRYPGIGPKTAACVLLFCLQRPCFAVDTHIFRICKWLGWVPDKANEVTAFSHLDVKIPDELKYSLHQLFIKHGKECPRCRAITSPASADWDKGCVIEHLLKRTGRKIQVASRQKVSAGSSQRNTKVTKSGVKGKRAATTKRTKKKTTVTRTTRKSAASQAALLPSSPIKNKGSSEEGPRPVDGIQDPAQPNSLKRKHSEATRRATQKKRPGRAGKKGPAKVPSKAKSTKSQKDPGTQKTTKKQKPAKAPAVPTRTSARLKLKLKQSEAGSS